MNKIRNKLFWYMFMAASMAIFLFTDNSILWFIATAIAGGLLVANVVAIGVVGAIFYILLPDMPSDVAREKGPEWMVALKDFSLRSIWFWFDAAIMTVFWFVIFLQYELLGSTGILTTLTLVFMGVTLRKKWIELIKQSEDKLSSYDV